MVAAAAVGALHAAVAGEEVAAEAVRDAVGAVLAHELVALHVEHRHQAGRVVPVEGAHDAVEVHDPGVATAAAQQLVDAAPEDGSLPAGCCLAFLGQSQQVDTVD